MLQKTDIVDPFDPSLIDVDIEVVNIGLLIDNLMYGRIYLKPEFQRASDLWTNVQKSRLIESILLGLPLPSFYFSEYVDKNDGQTKRQVIDGLQRLCALNDFVIKKTMRLHGLQFLKSYDGYSWDDLGTVGQLNFRSLKVTINTLRKSTPQKVQYVIFQRVNTAGKPLTAQEMRWALNQGEATLLLLRMAKNPQFLRATCNGVPNKRMEDLDYANRFLAFFLFLDQYAEYENLDDFMNASLEKVNEMTSFQIQYIEDMFETSMRACADIFGNDAFRKRYHYGERRRPLSKAVYDALSVNIAKLTKEQQQYLVEHKEMVTLEMMSLFANAKFAYSISTGTGKSQSVSTRFKMINEMINKILQNA